jgi:competence protein ComEC
MLCLAWLYQPVWSAALRPERHRPVLSVDMLAVGDGSCFLLRSGGRAMLFDCGSSNYAEIGRHTIVPALGALNVRRLDAIVISHADFDHFSGTLDVIDHVPTGRVITTSHVLDEAAASPGKATGYLVRQLRRRGVRIETIGAGWRMAFGRAQVEAIWPPAAATFERNNDSSIVLRITAGGRRVMMCGDIQAAAMQRMIDASMDIAADVTDLPHHGSFPPPAADWLGRVGPAIVLQSSSWRRVQWDKWAGLLEGVARHITARHGAARVVVMPDGAMRSHRFIRR